MMWTAEPHLEARKRIGFQVMIFLSFSRPAVFYQEEGVGGRALSRGRVEAARGQVPVRGQALAGPKKLAKGE